MLGVRLWPVLLFVIVVPTQGQFPRPAPPVDVSWTQGFEPRRETFSLDGRLPIELRFLFSSQSDDRDRVVESAKTALQLCTEWFGPYPYANLTIVLAPWSAPKAGIAPPGLVVVASRWLSPANDAALERGMITAIVRQYWLPAEGRAPDAGGFNEGLVRYAAARSINEALGIRHRQTYRFFGGFVPYTVRSLSFFRPRRDPRPLVRQFPEGHGDSLASGPWVKPRGGDSADRMAEALHALERFIGWPAMQQALHEFRRRVGDAPPAQTDFVAVVSEQRGQDLSWFFADGLHHDASPPAMGAAVDSNRRASSIAARLSGNWLLWLQDLMLTCTAIV